MQQPFQDLETQKSFQYLSEIETLAQNVLTLKQSKLEMANAQNQFREALRGLEKTEDRKTWLKMGAIYVERPTREVISILKDEISKAEENLSNLHEDIKGKVHKMRDLEHEPRLEGFTLKPISIYEAKALNKAFGSI